MIQASVILKPSFFRNLKNKHLHSTGQSTNFLLSRGQQGKFIKPLFLRNFKIIFSFNLPNSPRQQTE